MVPNIFQYFCKIFQRRKSNHYSFCYINCRKLIFFQISKFIYFNTSRDSFYTVTKISASVFPLAPFEVRLNSCQILNREIITFFPSFSLFIILNKDVWNEQFKEINKDNIIVRRGNYLIYCKKE